MRPTCEARNPEPSRHPHGDNDEVVMVVPPPPAPPAAHRAVRSVAPPGLVPADDPVQRIERSYHIDAIGPEGFELKLVEQVAIMALQDSHSTPIF